MHHPANSMTELCHGGEHDNTDGQSVPIYCSSWKKAILAVIGRSADLSVCQRVDEFGLPAIWCKIVNQIKDGEFNCRGRQHLNRHVKINLNITAL